MVDRISQLPIPILHHILCSLSQKEAVRTCLLSKQWRHLGSTRPKLDFSEVWFVNTQQTFVSVLDRTLQGYLDQDLFIHKLHLDLLRPEPVVSLLDKWIQILALKIKVFKLIFLSYSAAYYELPSAVFLAESLEELHLCQCMVSSVESVRFKQMRTLTLERVLINDVTLEKIMLGCPLLGRMALFSCREIRNVRLVSEAASCGLKHFELENFDWIEGRSIEIDVPNLETVRIDGPWIWCHRQSAFLFSRLTSLDLRNVILSSESFDLLSFGCPTLESLTIYNCSGFEEFHLASDSVKYLHISTRDIPIKGATISAPNILKFLFCIRQVPDTFSFTTTTSKEWDSNIFLSSSREDDPDFDINWWFLGLRRLLKPLSGSQIFLSLRMDGGPQDVPCSAFLSDEPPVVVRDLKFETCDWCMPSWYMGFTNGLFRVCRPSHVLGSSLAMELVPSGFQLNILLANEGQVRTGPNFWGHDLEQVFVETFDGQQWQIIRPRELRNQKQDGKIRLRLKWRCQDGGVAKPNYNIFSSFLSFLGFTTNSP
ncbi:Unknown protein [Striga hermonthica]|uniref:F-box domain-containing protein n=1 Tax=Striga hermonthica TaxID=68872 RepID=A0A9N7NN63_STRHE|nr:Unknown protein [Striga hermonthica]